MQNLRLKFIKNFYKLRLVELFFSLPKFLLQNTSVSSKFFITETYVPLWPLKFLFTVQYNPFKTTTYMKILLTFFLTYLINFLII